MAHRSTARTASRWSLAVGLALAAAVGTGGPALAVPADQPYVKYYQVAGSYQGAPENLSEISARFLGTTTRTAELFQLNTGRKQPDGGALTDPAVLHAGWDLVLPWDAVGPGVQYGVLPATAGTAVNGTGSGSRADSLSQSGTQPSPKASPTNQASSPGQDGQCRSASASSGQSDWAGLRLAPDQAWTHTRGRGEVVAIVDSGADGSLAQLTGHVTVGADVVAGSDRGDVDCLGTGTQMASIVVAQPAKAGGPVGIAPDATVMPVRVATTTATVQPADAANGISVAVSAGATVIALGGYVDPGDPAVASAIASASQHDAVVVAPAVTNDHPSTGSSGAPPSALIRVGAVGVNGQLASQYVAGGVDVVAPGLNVATLGMNGSGVQTATGTQYAVAYVAGEAALVRSAYPQLTAAATVHRIELTSDALGNSVPDSQFGYGMINPGTSVTKDLGDEERTGAHPAQADTGTALPSAGGRHAVSLVAALIGLAALILLILRVRSMIRLAREPEPVTDGDAGSA